MTGRAGEGGGGERALLDLAPVRRAEWDEPEGGDGRVVVIRPRPRRTGGLRGWWARVSHRLAMPRIRLDHFGSFVWRQLDGRRRVAEVGSEMRRRFGEEAEPAEERAGRFVAQLHELELILLPGFDPGDEVEEARQRDAGRPPSAPPAAGA